MVKMHFTTRTVNIKNNTDLSVGGLLSRGLHLLHEAAGLGEVDLPLVLLAAASPAQERRIRAARRGAHGVDGGPGGGGGGMAVYGAGGGEARAAHGGRPVVLRAHRRQDAGRRRRGSLPLHLHLLNRAK
jgi:hypothetical protein